MASDNQTATSEDRAAAALKAFPLPAQSETLQENYRRILHWLYGPTDAASLIIDLGFFAPKEKSVTNG